jgi:Na+/proline symporter
MLAMGQLLESALDVPLWIAIAVSAGATLGIVVWGGMWSVTWANTVMILVSLASVMVLFWVTCSQLGIEQVVEAAPKGHFRLDASSPSRWMAIGSVLVIGLFGNVPGQDIQQRVASAKSASTARWMCIWAGVLYLMFGMIPLYLGIAARYRFSDSLQETDLPIQRLAGLYLSQPLQVLLLVGMFSLALAVASGATLSQSSIVSRNMLGYWLGHRLGGMQLARASTVLVVVSSMWVAYSGESIMHLLELSLVIVLVSLFVPMTVALFFPSGSPRPGVGISGMLTGLVVWMAATCFEESVAIPASLLGLSASAIASWIAIKRLELVRSAR